MTPDKFKNIKDFNDEELIKDMMKLGFEDMGDPDIVRGMRFGDINPGLDLNSFEMWE